MTECCICKRQMIYLHCPPRERHICGACMPRAFGVGWLVGSPLWPHVGMYFRMEPHGRTQGAEADAYFRLEVEPPSRFYRGLLRLAVQCVSCGAPVEPFRMRQQGSGCYYASTCKLVKNPACCRSGAARLDHRSIVSALGAAPRMSALQPELW